MIQREITSTEIKKKCYSTEQSTLAWCNEKKNNNVSASKDENFHQEKLS